MALAQGFHNAPRLYGDDTVRKPVRITGCHSGLRAAWSEFIYEVSYCIKHLRKNQSSLKKKNPPKRDMISDNNVVDPRCHHRHLQASDSRLPDPRGMGSDHRTRQGHRRHRPQNDSWHHRTHRFLDERAGERADEEQATDCAYQTHADRAGTDGEEGTVG